MLAPDPLCLCIAIDRLAAADPAHYAIWVLKAPHPGGYVHHDCVWTPELSQAWQAWHQMFSLRGLPNVPHLARNQPVAPDFPTTVAGTVSPKNSSRSSRIMQHLGVSLWQWVFSGPIQSSLDHSLGIAVGQNRPLQLRLELRDPNLISLPWEIMQPQPGRQAISLGQNLCFSRTTSHVDALPELELDQALNVLLVLGQDAETANGNPTNGLHLKAEAEALKQVLEQQAAQSGIPPNSDPPVPCQVDTLLEPSPAQLIEQLETGFYNVFFYAGHGIPAPDGGLLQVQCQAALNGTELAQVLIRCRVKLAVFNTCWGAQPDQTAQYTLARSSLAEVLIHHGVPAVLAMRDSIADDEARSFIQVFTRALANRQSVDQAVAVARQQLLTLYQFNQPAWTLPVLYQHPEFQGNLLSPLRDRVTALPDEGPSWVDQPHVLVGLRAVDQPELIWPIAGGIMRIGRAADNDLMIPEPWVSQRHAELFCRYGGEPQPTYFLRDLSRNGTYCQLGQSWQQISHEEVLLSPGTQIRFGSAKGRLLEFIVEERSEPRAS